MRRKRDQIPHDCNSSSLEMKVIETTVWYEVRAVKTSPYSNEKWEMVAQSGWHSVLRQDFLGGG